MNSAIPTNRAAPPTLGSTLYALALIVLIAALAGIGLAYGLRHYVNVELSNRQASPPTDVLTVTIGPQRYAIPASMITDPAQRRSGFAERVDLALPVTFGDTSLNLNATLMPRGRANSSSALLDSVYLHQFSNEQISGAPGLVGKPLALDAGTRGEIVWYDPLNANPFVAKCMTPVVMSPHEATCLRVFALSDRNTMVVNFEPARLADWRRFDSELEAVIASMRQ